MKRAKSAALIAALFLTCSHAGVASDISQRSVPLMIRWDLSPSDIGSSCKSAIATADSRLTAIIANPQKPTFASVVVPIESVFADLSESLMAQLFLSSVSADATVRTASSACDVAVASFQATATSRPSFYAAIDAARRSNTATAAADRKLTEIWLNASNRAGAALSDSRRSEFVTLTGQLNDLQTRFTTNLDNDESQIDVRSDQVTGLPADFIATLTKTQTGYSIPVNESTTSTVLSNATDEDVRRRYYIAYDRRGGEANVQLLEHAIRIRDRLAKVFGYPSWAAYVLADKMAQTPQRVETFLQNLDAALIGTARQQRAQLASIKGSGEVFPWDTKYYLSRLRQQQYAVDQNQIRQYFTVDHVVPAVLGIYEKLFNVRFTPIVKPNIYLPEVPGYDVHDRATGEMLGTFYLDLYPRAGKYSHFANDTILARRVLPDGTIRPAIAVIVGNWPQPAPNHPALLSHNDVQTYFHEFGHNMAAMLARNPYATLNAGFRDDFVEAPSQMLENWVWDPAILKELSARYDTGAPFPDDLIAKMIATRYVGAALSATQQILYATVDMRYHTARPPVDTTSIWRTAVDQLTPNQFVEGTIPQANFSHIMGGYDAGYYGYLWSKVYAQDLFTAFQSAGLENPIVGQRYRDDILAPARTYEPDEEVAAFLGRPMSPAAFYTQLGLRAPDPHAVTNQQQ